MIRVYKNRNDIPEDMEYIQLNDIYFNETTCDMLDERAKDIIRKIDSSELISKYKIRTRFGDDILNIDKISSGCKTVLNVLYNPDKAFWLLDCGENALEVLMGIEKGNVFSETPMLPFELSPVEAYTAGNSRIIDDYEELKEWWRHEE
ncbi:MAG: DUF4869 domain-containing protein [Clostridiales bacterium]|nr:DUF4869 domain-containing protein [Clostridiales bacterium]